ncbi:318_t:CDS:2 [Paraglomus occultum]|uniref:318_t:CDS:1 n=1 Tax=Paraglomus occultum TaxID=144539 RepID=A0A9N8WMT2_9GLOM|nr:318_t:CDS:2 [Paraglomus occultum]
MSWGGSPALQHVYNMNDNTKISDFLQEFVRDERATQEEVNELAESLKRQWLKKIGDFKRFTTEELKSLNMPAMMIKHLEEQEFVKSPEQKRQLMEHDNHDNGGPLYKKTKIFSVNGTITPSDYKKYFVVDQTEKNQPLVNHILNRQFVSFHAPRASGKSTRMMQLAMQLQSGIQTEEGVKKYKCIYVDFQKFFLEENDNQTEKFWYYFGNAFPEPNILPVQINSADTFLTAFKKDDKWWNLPVVLLLDEFDTLYAQNVMPARNACLQALRAIRSNQDEYIIDSIIIIGTFGVVMMNQENPNLSPFNITESLKGESLSYESVIQLFNQYVEARNIQLDRRIVDDIYHRTNGLVGNLGKPEMRESITLLQKKFLANAGPVTITNAKEIELSGLLAKEGALNVVDKNAFVMASPLLRSLIIKNTLNKWMSCPSTDIPLRQAPDYSLNILESLKTVIPLFNQQDMKNGALFSFKIAPGRVDKKLNMRVPQVSVYQQQLVGIFQNWLSTFSFEIIGQYHMKNTLGNGRYCDVVLTEPNYHMTAVLELLATSTESQLKNHYKCALEYADSLRICSTQNIYRNSNFQFLNIRDIWVIHFTCEDDATKAENCKWPTTEQNLNPETMVDPQWPTVENLNVVTIWHNLEFTEIRMSACWKDQKGGAWQELYNEKIFPKS